MIRKDIATTIETLRQPDLHPEHCLFNQAGKHEFNCTCGIELIIEKLKELDK
jgi:hypothetical protein